MSSDEEENALFDLRNMEDVFACLEIVAMAQAMLSSVDPDTANELEKVTEALGALSLLIDQGELVQVVQPEGAGAAGQGAPASSSQPPPAPPSGEVGIDDLVEFVGGGKASEGRSTPDDEDDSIIDILTGEKLR